MTERGEHRSNITYLYHALADCLDRGGGRGELLFGGGRTALRICTQEQQKEDVRARTRDKVAEIIGIGYKYRYLQERLRVCLGERERKWLCAALIAADFEGDKGYIVRKLKNTDEYSIDGFYQFRLSPLREKWERIADYIPSSFDSSDLKKFCDFLIGESERKIYLRGKSVFGENFRPLRRSRLTGEEDTETEIMLSDAGFVYCLGDVEESVADFLQKYYAERAIFS